MATAQAAEYYDYKRPHVAEYPAPPGTETVETIQKSVEQKAGQVTGSTITLNEIQRDRITKIAVANWSTTRDVVARPAFNSSLVDEIYRTELLVTSGNKSVPLQRVMVLEVSQYLENYLWPNFDPETSTFEHLMSIVLMVNEKFRENVSAWGCFHDRKDAFEGFFRRILLLKEQGRSLNMAEKTNYLLFLIHSFQEQKGSAANRI